MRAGVCHLVLVANCLLVQACWGQGQVVFDNRVQNVVIAPVYGVDPNASDLANHGNTPTGFPPGIQNYIGPLLEGPGYSAQLFGGPANEPDHDLDPLLPITVFRDGVGAGFVVAPAHAVTVPGVPENQRARLQLRVWENRAGTVITWTEAESDFTLAKGTSLSFLSPPLGGALLPPPNLIGLESFNLTTPRSDQSWNINFQPAGSAAPPGWLVDSGLVIGPREESLVYGWNVDHAENAVDRDDATAPDQRYDTFIQMNSSPPSTWELQLPNGLYRVHLAAGDSLDPDADYRIDAEGSPFLSGRPAIGFPWIETNRVVQVTDGYLTLTANVAGVRNRVNFASVTAIPAPVLTASLFAEADVIGFRFTFDTEPGVGYEVQESGDLEEWQPIGPPTALPSNTNTAEFIIPSIAAKSPSFYRVRQFPSN